MFGRRKKQTAPAYDKAGKVPVIRSSICTGEQVAGFKDIHTGKFTDIMLIKDDKDMNEFLERYGIAACDITKEW